MLKLLTDMTLKFKFNPVPRVLLVNNKNLKVIDTFPLIRGEKLLLRFNYKRRKYLTLSEIMIIYIDEEKTDKYGHNIIMVEGDKYNNIINEGYTVTEIQINSPLIESITMTSYEILYPDRLKKKVDFNEEVYWDDFNKAFKGTNSKNSD